MKLANTCTLLLVLNLSAVSVASDQHLRVRQMSLTNTTDTANSTVSPSTVSPAPTTTTNSTATATATTNSTTNSTANATTTTTTYPTTTTNSTTTTTTYSTTTTTSTSTTTEWCVEELGECELKYLVNYPVDEPSSITMDLACEGEAWIGIGFSLDGIMDGSEAVIAGTGQEPRKYHLGGKWFGQGGVSEMPESQQTLIDTKVRVELVEGSNGPIPLTKMRFTKLLSEPNEIEIKPGENIFLYAQGSTPSFPSYHAARDSFTLTLPSNGSDSGVDTSVEGEAPATPEMHITDLSPECTLKHAINVPTYTTRDECVDCSITMELTCDSVAWVAVGFSVNGFMPRSEAVIGIPGSEPEKYFLKRRNSNKIFRLPDEAQTLTDASVSVDDGETVMRFTKLLNEPNEIPVTQELFFLFAHGRDENFAYHGPNSRGRFQLNLL